MVPSVSMRAMLPSAIALSNRVVCGYEQGVAKANVANLDKRKIQVRSKFKLQ